MSTQRVTPPTQNRNSQSIRYDLGANGKKNNKVSDNPLDSKYWTQERLDWLHCVVKMNCARHEEHLETTERVTGYRNSTFDLIRDLKTQPGWAALSPELAHVALTEGLSRLYGKNGWGALPMNALNQMDPEDDFLRHWPRVKARLDVGVFARAVLSAKANPLNWGDEWEKRLYPLTRQFKLFCDVCIILQTLHGNNPILLPQEKLAELLETKQPNISGFCQRAQRAGFLKKVNPNYSYIAKRAIEWWCAVIWNRS
jgi:hypothetical protein